jgi:GNAT superfamily N-acetyltransferase
MEASQELLQTACEILADQGCTLAVGPMDGCTWRSYRFVTERGDFPPFLFDLSTPPEYPAWWEAAEFQSFQTYHSDLAENLDHQDPRLDRVRARIEKAGIHIRSMDPEHFEEELIRIYGISEQSFQGNVLYTPLSQEAFLDLYRPAAALVSAGFSLLAEGPDGPEGFIFTVPDMLQAKRGETLDRVVVKTLAVRPGRATAGLGKLLLEESQRKAHAHGFPRAIHALMHDQNVSTLLGGGRCIRRYALFARTLL